MTGDGKMFSIKMPENIYAGANSMEAAASIVSALSVEPNKLNIAIITDSGVVKTNIYPCLMSILEKTGACTFLFSLPWIASNQIELFKICPIVTICLGEQVCSRIGPVGASARSVTGEGAPDDAPCDCDSENCPPASPVAPSVLVLNMTDPLTGTDQSVRTVRSLRNPR